EPVVASYCAAANMSPGPPNAMSPVVCLGVDPGRPRKDRPFGESGSSGQRADLLSFQVLRSRNASAFAGDDRAGWLVVDHECRFERGTFVSVTELNERIDIAEADVVGAGGDAIDRFERTVS